MTVIDASTGLYAPFKFLPEGTEIMVYRRDNGSARTNVVAVLRKEPGGGWDDWQILKPPPTADSSLLPATWPAEDPAVISSRDLPDALGNDHSLWANLDD